MIFTVAAYDSDTYSSLGDSASNEGSVFAIATIEEPTTWRELLLIARTVNKSLGCTDVAGCVGLGIMNNIDTVTFPLADILPGPNVNQVWHPQRVCKEQHTKITHTDLSLNNDDITELMKLLPLGNSSHSGLREKLHQASIAINKKR